MRGIFQERGPPFKAACGQDSTPHDGQLVAGHYAVACVNRLNPVAFNFHRDGSHQKTDGNYNAMLLVQFDKNPFETRQRPMLKPHLLSDAKERPGLNQESGLYGALNCSDFSIINRDWNLANTDEMQHSGNRQNGKPVLWVQSAEYVTGKERRLHRLKAI